MKILVLIILFILLYILLNKNSKIEKFINRNKKIKIGFLIPTTSKNRNYKKIEEIYFIKIFIINLIPTISKNFEYEIYLGYDYDDLFYINNNIKIKNYFNNNTPKNISLSFYKFKKEKGSLSVMWNTLAKEAYNSCDYFYQCGDDIKFYDSEWSEKFVNVLKKNNNIGVTGPLDLNNKKLLTQSFVHKTHLDIFGYYYPPSIKNWYVDDWIHQVYQPNNNFWLKEIKVRNSGGPPRYQVNKNKNIFYEELNKGKNKLNNFLNQKETFSNITTNSDYIISMFLTGGLNEEAHNCIHTLKKVGMANNLIVTCLDKKAYDYISKLGVKTVYRKTDLSGDAKFGSQKFYNIMIQKIEIIKELLIKYNKIVVYTDTDIVFLKNINSDINKFIKSNLDIQIQDDRRTFVKKPSNNLCAGFMFLKPNKLIFKTLDKILDLLNVGKADGGTSDQKVLNIVIQETKPNIEILDLKDYPNGSRYFNNIELIYKDYKPKIIHNNYIIGTQNKIDRFKKHNLWFIENKVSEFFTNNINSPYLYGTKYGGFYLPKNITKDFFNTKNIIYYGVGVGQDISFDLIIGNQLNADVLLIDPTPKAKKHYEKIKKFIETDIYTYNKQEGGGEKGYEMLIRNNKINLNKLKYENSGIGILNSTQKFYMNKNPNYVSGSFDKNMNSVNSSNYINVSIKTIDTIMAKYNHNTIDILKLDIEGLEIEVLNYILDKNILPKIICIDFDSVREGKRKNEFELLKQKLNELNYILYYNDNFDITFIRN